MTDDATQHAESFERINASGLAFDSIDHWRGNYLKDWHVILAEQWATCETLRSEVPQ